MSGKLIYCEKGCTNKKNTTGDCEHTLFEYLNSGEALKDMEEYYDSKCRQYNKEIIYSSTILDGQRAADILYSDIANMFLGCSQLKKSISTLSDNYADVKFIKKIKSSVQKKIRLLMYGDREVLESGLKLGHEFENRHDTELFTNIFIRIDSIYKCSKLIGK